MISPLLHKTDENSTDILSNWCNLISLECYKMYIRVTFCKLYNAEKSILNG